MHFCAWCETVVRALFSPSGYPGVAPPFVENTPFSVGFFLHLC